MPLLKEITPQNIQLWAYDDDLYFLEQDEDLMLHHPTHVPTLMELAAQDGCPKQEYIKSILEYYIQWCFLYKKTHELEDLNEVIITNKTLLTTTWLVLWAVNFQFIYKVFTTAQRLTDAACDKIAKDLTIGDYCKRNFEFISTLSSGVREYLASTETFKLYFYINPLNGQWKISTQERLIKFD